MHTRLVGISIGVAALIAAGTVVPAAAQSAAPAIAPLTVSIVQPTLLPPAGRFIPPHVAGDAEFDGNGPDVTTSARLSVPAGGTRLFVTMCFFAQETQQDFTKVDGCSAEFTIFTTQPGQCIQKISRTTFDRLDYRDNDATVDVFDGQGGNSFVRRWDVVGDTSGAEAGTRTGALIVTRQIVVTTAPCASPAGATEQASAPLAEISVPPLRFPPSTRYIPPHTGLGDREFDGHGPRVTANAWLVGLGGPRLTVIVCVSAVETVFDFTRASGCSADFLVSNAPPGECFLSANLGTFDSVTYTDTDAAVDQFPGQLSGSFVSSYDIVGDTDGDEAGTETGSIVFTHGFTVTTTPCVVS